MLKLIFFWWEMNKPCLVEFILFELYFEVQNNVKTNENVQNDAGKC